MRHFGGIETEALQVFSRIGDADGTQQSHGDEIERLRQRLAQASGPIEFFAVILRAPFVFGRRTLHHDRRAADCARGGESLVQCGGEDKGFNA